jgi:subtilisin family serine protease
MIIAVGLACLLAFTPAVAEAAPGPPDAPEWWFDAWHVPALRASGADGRGITVAVIDTGVQADIPELSGKVLAGADFIGNGSDGRIDFDGDAFSHGTAMASIIAASKGSFGVEGLAPAAKILPIAVPLKGVLRHGLPVPDATTKAIRYAADHGAKIISMSLGGFEFQDSQHESPCPTNLQDAVIYALTKGALVLAASGNSGIDGSPVEEPGVCLGVVSVGSVDASLNVARFSSRHPYLTLAAPGSSIPSLSRDAGRAFVGDGTSQSTAVASAAIALVWSKHPTETNRQVLDRVLASVTDRGAKGRDAQYGLGVINPQRALAATVTESSADPVFDGVGPLLALATSITKKPSIKTAAGNADAPIGQIIVGKEASVLGASQVLDLGATGFSATLGIVLLVLGFRRRPGVAVRRVSGSR